MRTFWALLSAAAVIALGASPAQACSSGESDPAEKKTHPATTQANTTSSHRAHHKTRTGAKPSSRASKPGSTPSGGSTSSGSQQPARAKATVPGQVLNLANWKLTLPTSSGDVAAEVKQPQLATYSSSYFKVNEAGDGVVFRAHMGGATTKGSSYPRSELREMTNSGKDKAAWSTSSGTHTMSMRAAITHLPVAKPHLVVAQIHDAEDDVIAVRLDGSTLYVDHDSDNYGTLDNSYKLGKVFDLTIVASGGRVTVTYNGLKKVDRQIKTTDNYFKAGVYPQSNTSKGDKSTAYGESVIYRLTVSHK